MTETELTDRLREAIVLDGPDAWRSNGYLQEAHRAGLSEANALKLAKEVGQEIAGNSLLFQNIQTRIARMAQPSRAQLKEQDLHQILNAATSLKLSPDFVRNRWVPTVLERLAPAPIPPAPPPSAVTPPPAVVPPVIKSDPIEEFLETRPELPKPNPATEPPAPVEKPVVEQRPEVVVPPPVIPKLSVSSLPLSPPEPPPLVRSFTATPARVYKGDPVTLSWEVDNLLAVTIDDLGEGLSPNNRGWVKPTKTTDYTLFDAHNNPLSTVRVEVLRRDRSGVYGILFALVLLALIYWFVKRTNSTPSEPKSNRKTEQTTSAFSQESRSKPTRISESVSPPDTSTTEATDSPAETATGADPALADTPKTDELSARQPADENPTDAEPETKPTTPADARQGKYAEAFGDKPYDKVELGVDERGWRRARSNGRWGYVNEADEWMIKPEYEAVTPFRGNTAAVFLNGQLMTINRSGEQVRN